MVRVHDAAKLGELALRLFEHHQTKVGALVLTAQAPYGMLFRLDDKRYASLDPYKYEWGNDDEYDIVTYLELSYFPIRSHTRRGWTIKASNGNGWRFIARDAHRQYAAPTLEGAVASYRARKKRQIAIYEGRVQQARGALRLAGLDFLP